MNLDRTTDVSEREENYRAYLLRCWQEDVDGEPQWRFTLLEAGYDAGKRGFASLEEVVGYLKDELGEGQ